MEIWRIIFPEPLLSTCTVVVRIERFKANITAQDPRRFISVVQRCSDCKEEIERVASSEFHLAKKNHWGD